MPVHSETLARGELKPTLPLLGTVRPSETIALIAVRGGTLRHPARFAGGLRTGEHVATGETIATIENEDARNAVDAALLEHENATAELDRARKGHELGVLTDMEAARAEHASRVAESRLASARRSTEPLRLFAPRPGRLVVTEHHADGAQVLAGARLAELAIDGPLRVECAAAAADRERLAPGLTVRFRRPGADVATASGTLREVASVVDDAGTVRVIADVLESEGLPAPGEGVDVQVELPPLPEALTVPEAALILGSSGSAVFMIEQSNLGPQLYVARRMFVELGVRGNGRVEIIRGIDEGAKVAISGVSFLEEGTLVQDVPSRPAP